MSSSQSDCLFHNILKRYLIFFELYFCHPVREIDIKGKICMGCPKLVFSRNKAYCAHKNKSHDVLQKMPLAFDVFSEAIFW